MENECFAIHSWFSWVSDNPDSSSLQGICESSANRSPGVSTSSVYLEARPEDGTHRTVIRSTSQLCVACLNMQLQPGHIRCQLSPPANMRKLSWRRPEPSAAFSALQLIRQSSRNSSCSLFQCVSKPSHTKKLTRGPIFHLPTIVVQPSSPHADSAWWGKTCAALNFTV